jgi:hypothetical protein
MDTDNRYLTLAVVAIMVLIVLLYSMHIAPARDLGQWDAVNSDSAVRDWYRNLMRPDVPTASCCGEADAYWADEVHVRAGKTYAVITDDRPDAPRGRPHIPVGTEIEVPPEKLKWDSSNPTGHNILFVTVAGYAWCFVQSTGI